MLLAIKATSLSKAIYFTLNVPRVIIEGHTLLPLELYTGYPCPPIQFSCKKFHGSVKAVVLGLT